MTLLRDIDMAEFSEEAIGFFQTLALVGPTEEAALVIIAAAARLLATNATNRDQLDGLIGEFGDVAGSWFVWTSTANPRLRIVGGTDVG